MIKTPSKIQEQRPGGPIESPVGARMKSTEGKKQAAFSKIDPASGKVFDARSPSALKEAGNLALKKGDLARAVHMYTLGIDLCIGNTAEARPKDPASWFAADQRSGGELHKLLSNRSFVQAQLQDFCASRDDAECCCQARPDFEKGHLRLISALELCGAPDDERLAACARAALACPRDKRIAQAKAAIEAGVGRGKGQQDKTKRKRKSKKSGKTIKAQDGKVKAASAPAPTVANNAAVDARIQAQIEATRRIAEDASDPRRAMAAGDLGSLLATGAYGVPKDLALAEHYLRIGADGGDAGAQVNLGHLLLDRGLHVEAAKYLSAAAAQGSDAARELLGAIAGEAEEKRKAARRQLEKMAEEGDPRARSVLAEVQARGESIQ